MCTHRPQPRKKVREGHETSATVNPHTARGVLFLFFSLPFLTSPQLTSTYLTLPYPALPHLTSPHLASCDITSRGMVIDLDIDMNMDNYNHRKITTRHDVTRHETSHATCHCPFLIIFHWHLDVGHWTLPRHVMTQQHITFHPLCCLATQGE